jgi:hypothetical protein
VDTLTSSQRQRLVDHVQQHYRHQYLPVEFLTMLLILAEDVASFDRIPSNMARRLTDQLWKYYGDQITKH